MAETSTVTVQGAFASPADEGPKSRRLPWVDVARGLGIICVILAHTLSRSGVASALIFTCNMPLFFFLSGYCTSFSADAKTFIRSKAVSLLVPYFISIAIYIAYSELVFGLSDFTPLSIFYATNKVVKQMPLLPLVGVIWFLPALFIANLVAFAISRASGDRVGCTLAMLVAATTVAGIAIGNIISLPLSVDVALASQIFIFSGVAVKREKIFQERFSWAIAIPSALTYALSGYHGGLSMNSREYAEPLIAVVGAIGGSILMVYLSRVLANIPLISAPLRYIGRAAIIILSFHMFDTVTGHFSLAFPEFFAFLHHQPLLLALFRLLFSLALYEIFRHIPLLRTCYSLPAAPPRPSLPVAQVAEAG